jgi:hypothetical protein
MKKREIVVFLLLATSILTGCALLGLTPFIPVVGGSYEGYTVWQGRQSSKYYTYEVKTICQVVRQSCEQLKLEAVIQDPALLHGCTLETKGNYPMEINVSYVEKNLTKVVITIALFGDKQYAELLYRTIDDNVPKKMDKVPPTTDNIPKTTTGDK